MPAPLNGAANKSLRRHLPAQWRCEQELTETHACSMALRTRAYGDTCLLHGAANKSLRRHMPAPWRCEQELTETPARSIAPRTRAYRDACPLNSARNHSLRRRPPAQWRRAQGLLGPVEGPPRRIPHPSVPAPVVGGRSGRGSDAPGETMTPPPFPQQGAWGAAPAGGTASPPVLENVGGRSGRDSGAGQDKNLRPGGARLL